jgi:hypothetical protein
MTVAAAGGASMANRWSRPTRDIIVLRISAFKTRQCVIRSWKSAASSRAMRDGPVARRLAMAGDPSSSGTSPK